MKSRSLPLVILPILTLLLGWQFGQQYERMSMLGLQTHASNIEVGSGTVISDPQKEVDLSLLWTTWRLLMTRYVYPDQLTTQKMVEGAVRGMVASLGDPYTLFMSKQETSDFQDMLSGHLEGIGAQLSLDGGIVNVVSIIKNSPAQHSGLLAKDIIEKVDGKMLGSMTLDQVVGMIRGKKGTSVTLTVIRAGEPNPLTFTIVRDEIQVPSVTYDTKQTAKGTIGVLSISEFGADTINEVQDLLSTVHEGSIKGLIVDLRDNGGGYLDGAVSLSSMFVKEGRVVTVAGRSGDTEVHDVSGNPILPNVPMVVLINRGTASASEIFAGAMKDHKRAEIIGLQSFGKGTVQEVLDLGNGDSLRVTIARWLTPNGTDLGKVGITPDIVVDLTADDIKSAKDPQKDAAIEFLTTGKVVKVKTGTGVTE